MRLALVAHKVAFQDGQGRVNYELARAALERGDDVTVIAEFCSDEIANHPKGQFIRVSAPLLPTQLLRNLYFATMSARYLGKHRGEFDIVQANGFITWEPVNVVAVHFVHSAWLRNPCFPFHWSSFSPYAYYQRFLTILNGFFEKKVFKSAEVLIAVSRFTAFEVAELGVPAEKIIVVQNGVDLEEFYPGQPMRPEFGLPKGVLLALFVGDIKTTRKNLDTVLKAMLELPELHLAVAGALDGSPYPRMAADLGIVNRVHFVGKTFQIAELMRSCDFFVFPSRYEAHPLVLMEAMASGLPVIVSDNFGAADYIHGGGIVFKDANDVSALIAAMMPMMYQPEKRRLTSEAARQQAMEMPWSRTANGYLAVYDRLMEARSIESERVSS